MARKKPTPPVPTPLPVAAAQPTPQPPVLPYWSSSGLAEWRKSKERVEWTAALLADPMFRQFLAMLRWESQQYHPAPLEQLAINIEFGRGEGRRNVLDWIEQAAQFAVNKNTAPLEQPNYGVPDAPEDLDLTGGMDIKK